MDLANDGGEIGMKRKWNWPIWVGLVVTVGGLLSYGFFAQFPITRDFPWANLLLLGVGAALLILASFARLAGRNFIAVRSSAPSLQRSFCFFSDFSVTKFFTFCTRFRSPLKRRALAKRRPNSRCSIKMESKSRWRICFQGRELSC